MKPAKRIYVHFADYYHHERARLNLAKASAIFRTLSDAIRISVLFANEVFFPASSIFESANCRRLMLQFPEFRESGVFKISAGHANVAEHVESKLKSYGESSPSHFLKSYRKRHGLIFPSYIQKKGSSTESITVTWRAVLEDDTFLAQIRASTGVSLPPGFEKVWARVPEDLEGQAFVPAHAAELLRRAGGEGHLSILAARPIERAYIDGYLRELDAHALVGVPHISSDLLECELRSVKKLRYIDLYRALTTQNLMSLISEAPSRVLFELSCDPEWDRLSIDLVTKDNSKHASERARYLRERLEAKIVEQPDMRPRQMELSIMSKRPAAAGVNVQTNKFDTAILTALPVEYAALRLLAGQTKLLRVDEDPNSYSVATVQTVEGKPKAIVLGMLNRMGNASAATATTNLIRSFGTKHLLFCGIALGVPFPSDPTKHVRLGDVVVADRKGVIQMDHRSLGPEGEVNRSNLPPPPAQMARALNEIDSNRMLGEAPWELMIDRAIEKKPAFKRPDPSTDVVLDAAGDSIPHPGDSDRMPGRPKLIRGLIGSSDTLVKDLEYRDKMASKLNLRAMEMEAAGVLEAAWNFGQSAMIVRGICDYGPGKNDLWHAYASLAAAAVALSLISRV